MRLPYELVAIQADIILMQIILSGNLEYYWDCYQTYIIACGWDSASYDQECLKRIDANWDSLTLN